MKRLFFLLGLTLSVSGWADFYQDGCTLYNSRGGLVRSFPGILCLFLEDGSFISAGNDEIRRITPDHSVVWTYPYHAHHQMNLTPDGKGVVVLGSETVFEKGEWVRYDEFLHLNLEGNVVARNSYRNIGEKFLHSDAAYSGSEARVERSHFNSIFLIGPQTDQSTLKEGNYVVNSLELGVFILDQELKKIEAQFDIPHSNGNFTHDVRPLEDGTFLLFNNGDFVENQEMAKSAVQVFDPKSKSITYSYHGEGIPFIAWCCGGVQRIDDDRYLYSLPFGGAFVFSRATGQVIHSVELSVKSFFQPIQNLRFIHLSEKFQNSWGISQEHQKKEAGKGVTPSPERPRYSILGGKEGPGS